MLGCGEEITSELIAKRVFKIINKDDSTRKMGRVEIETI